MSEPILLPEIDTDEGVIARVLIAESQNPGWGDYDEAAVKQGMFAMKAVVDNRLGNHPEWFLAPGAANYGDIVTAPGQWAGFSREEGEIVVAPPQQALIDRILEEARADSPDGPYARFYYLVMEVSESAVQDPFADLWETDGIPVIGGGYGWKTEGANPPGGRFQRLADADGGLMAGNRFYTLREA